jgi:GAF domain-containing protein
VRPTPATPTPADVSPSSRASPKGSVPTFPTIPTAPPSRAAATAWLPPCRHRWCETPWPARSHPVPAAARRRRPGPCSGFPTTMIPDDMPRTPRSAAGRYDVDDVKREGGGPPGRRDSSRPPAVATSPGMAEAFNETVLPTAKAERYAAVAEEIAAVLDGEPNLVARMATVARCWPTASTLLLDRLLRGRSGQGGRAGGRALPGHPGLHAHRLGRGVCGTAAALRQTQVGRRRARFPRTTSPATAARPARSWVPVFDRRPPDRRVRRGFGSGRRLSTGSIANGSRPSSTPLRVAESVALSYVGAPE